METGVVDRAAQFVADWNSGNIEQIVSQLAEDVELRARNPRGMPGRRRSRVSGKQAVAELLRSAIALYSGYMIEDARDDGGSISLNLLDKGLVSIMLRFNDDGLLSSIDSYRAALGSPMLATRIVPRAV